MNDSRHAVDIRVPDDQRYQLVYQATFTLADISPEDLEVPFVKISSALGTLRHLPLLKKTFGWGGTLKILLKTLTGKRHLYGSPQSGRMVHHGWLSLGFCRHYHVHQDDIVIGSIWTDPAARGQRLATRAISQAMREGLRDRAHRTFHIDTASDNFPCQKVISHLGFGAPVALYLRGRKRSTSNQG